MQKQKERGLIDFAVAFPGETAYAATANLMTAIVNKASPAVVDEAAKVALILFKGWHNWWVSMGWPGEKI